MLTPLLLSGCALMPDALPVGVSHTSHALQHMHGENYGYTSPAKHWLR